MKTSLTYATLLASFVLGCGASSDLSILARNAPISCTIQTSNGRYLTAVGGGGRTTDVLHTDATVARSWETFTLLDAGDGSSNINYGIIVANGQYLTAVGGGGRITDVIHSNATRLQAWEKFALLSLGGGIYGIQTANGRFLTATGGGGRIIDAIHSDATEVRAWERFRFTCRNLH